MSTNRKTRSARHAGITSLVGIGIFAGLALSAQGDVPGAHPHYLHALSDLRYARAFLDHGDESNVQGDEGAGIIEIDAAIGEIRRAAIDDGKNLGDHPPIDVNLNHKDRLGRAAALLNEARHDLGAFREDDKAALGWRQAAIGHVNTALRDARQAQRADYHDDHPLMKGDHAHFLHALSNLRAARGLLSAPDEGNVMNDEKAATDQITRAIQFAKQGAIDDGLDIFYNPPADATNLPRHDRLQRARKLVGDAHYDLTHYPETDGNALGVQRGAVAFVDRAWKSVNKAIADDRRDDHPTNPADQ